VSRRDREDTVAVLSKRIQATGGVIVFDYTGLNVEKVTGLRRQIRDVGSELKVAKNTLLKIATQGTHFEKLNPTFTGQTAVAFIDGDPAQLAKVLSKFVKDNAELPCSIRAGVLGPDELSQKDIEALGSLPSREVLLGQLLAVMAAPLTGLVSVMAEIPRKFLRALSAVADKKQAE
jgi:large subunit ribosomal protein L10